MSIIYTDKDGVRHKTAGKEVPKPATDAQFGVVQFSNSTNVETNNGLALSATEKNPNVPGSLANMMGTKLAIVDESIKAQKGSGYLGGGNLYDKDKTTVNLSWANLPSPTEATSFYNLVVGRRYTVKVHDFATNVISLTVMTKTSIESSTPSWYTALTSSVDEIIFTADAPVLAMCVTFDTTASRELVDAVKITLEEGEEAHDYVPYSKSNVELTKELSGVVSEITTRAYTYNGLKFNVVKVKNCVIITMGGNTSAAMDANVDLFLLEPEFRPKATTGTLAYLSNTAGNLIGMAGFYAYPDGTVKYTTNLGQYILPGGVLSYTI